MLDWLIHLVPVPFRRWKNLVRVSEVTSYGGSKVYYTEHRLSDDGYRFWFRFGRLTGYVTRQEALAHAETRFREVYKRSRVVAQ